jgi:rhamnose utilization protein RhaD (predicted bifunctional aldolase and dehydrogenase)/NAD(P)-dependent dehydrogenase (short-subunit alcohol dehydrogenase family)
MRNLWDDQPAAEMVRRYAEEGLSEDLALRTYTTRLLGSEPRLVLHGGGNTSVKTRVTDMLGDQWEVLCVKGSGWDMATIEPAGLPAVKLAPLLKARRLDRLSDERMVALLRSNLIDPGGPNPSVETLLHAFLPHKFVDHTHSTAILSLVDQANSREIRDRVFGSRLGFVEYVMPGFDLANQAAEVYDQEPQVEGLILDKHGIFTFGETARQSYDRMIHFVSLAEDYVRSRPVAPVAKASLPEHLASAIEIAPMLRGAVAQDCGEGGFNRVVSDFRVDPGILDFVNRADLSQLVLAGVSTPDLSIRIKTGPMALPAPSRDGLQSYRDVIDAHVAAFASSYKAYFDANAARRTDSRTMLDPMPRLALVAGVGLFGHGRTIKDARIAADLGEMWIETVRDAQRVGSFKPVGRSDLFDLEYWPLEQAKLANAKKLPLTGQVAAITGGAGAIGVATAAEFARAGAHVALADLDLAAAIAAADRVGNDSIGLRCDVTDPSSVAEMFDAVVGTFGGVDIVISNAGAAWQGAIATLDDVILRKSFELNFFAHQTVARHAVRIMRQQRTGGVLLFNASKQAVNPGANFGAYGLPKAATLFLSRQYALEHGADNVRVGAVNADRIRSGLLNEDMIAERSRSRGVTSAEYMAGNLLRMEVRAKDVAQAFLHQALAERTTSGITTVDGGNIAAALR